MEMFEKVMVIIVATLWIAMLIAILGMFGWWLVSELVSGLLHFIFV